MRTDLMQRASLRGKRGHANPCAIGRAGGAVNYRVIAVLLLLALAGVAAVWWLRGDLFVRPKSIEAKPLRQEAPKRPTLVATFRDVPPDMLIYSKDRFSGPLRHVIEEAADRIGYDIKWKPAPFAESLTMAVQGEIDIVPFARFKTPEREKVLRFSESMGKVMTVTYFLQHASDFEPIKTLEDLKGRRIAYRPGSYYFDEFHNDPGLTKVGYSDDAKLSKGFIDRKADVIIVNIRPATERALALAGYGANNYKYAELKIEREAELYMIYTRAPERQAIFDKLDKALAQMRDTRMIEEIYKSFDADPPLAK